MKIGFVLPCNSRDPLPSTRIAVLNMLPFLRAAGFDPHIVFEPEEGNEQRPAIPDEAERLHTEGYRIVLFQKVTGLHAERLARHLSTLGVKTIFGVCDLVEPAMVDATDATVAVTEYLKGLYPPSLQPKVHVVHDGIENPDACKDEWGGERGLSGKRLRAVLVVSSSLSRLPVIRNPSAGLDVTVVGDYPSPSKQPLRYLQQARWKLLQQRGTERMEYLSFLLNPRIHCVPWDPRGVYEQMRRADIGIIPIDTTAAWNPHLPVAPWTVKSENRLTLKMSMGLPVIATPIPSYEAVIEHGANGFLARTRHEWASALDALRDPHLRREVGERARATVCERFSMSEQARRLVAVFARVLGSEALPARATAASIDR